MKKIKAVALFSGGLDSILAVKLIQQQGIDVIALHFITPFFGNKKLKEKAKKYNISAKIIDVTEGYLKILRKPKHGYGKNINPCIDCKIFMLKQAKKQMKKLNAKFIITGEILGQRPMSQNKPALNLIEKEAKVKGILVRPLCAKLLLETSIEKKGYVDRSKLLDIHGRTRKRQMELAKKYKIKDYLTPAGGCLLTFIGYAVKVKDLLKNKKRISKEDLYLLKIGRHFRFGKNKIIVGRDEKENRQLLNLKNKTDSVLEVIGHMGPITLLQGPKTKKVIGMAASLTVRYSDAKGKTKVRYGKKTITALPMHEKKIEKIRIR